MNTLNDEIAAFKRMQSDLETEHFGKWAIVHHGELTGTYDSFEEAANEAVRKFGRGPYLIRQIGVPAPNLPSSVLYRDFYAS